MSDYGTVTIGTGTPTPAEVKIESFVRSIWKDNRLAQCIKLEDGTYCIAIENMKSSGRNPRNTIRLSEESFIALVVNIHLYAEITGMNLLEMSKNALKGEEIQYEISDNLQPLKV